MKNPSAELPLAASCQAPDSKVPRLRAHEDIIAAILKVPFTNGRRIIAIVGPPASGKSTLTVALQTQIPGSCVVPMDGFHLDNDTLERRGLLAKKGAPETFDVAGFERLLKTIRGQNTAPFPTFDRTQDRSISAGGCVSASDQTILVEGNYLLLNIPPWDRLHGFWDFSIFLEVDAPELERRLVARWLAHDHSEDQARTRAHQNDLPNAKCVIGQSLTADLVVRFD